jgi:hypothetical protein
LFGVGFDSFLVGLQQLTTPNIGLNRGANNITNTIEAAKAAVREIPNLYALELGNEPVSFPSLAAIIFVFANL